jgi:hypothetical protein
MQNLQQIQQVHLSFLILATDRSPRAVNSIALHGPDVHDLLPCKFFAASKSVIWKHSLAKTPAAAVLQDGAKPVAPNDRAASQEVAVYY